MDLTHLPSAVYVLITLVGAAFVLTWRFRETKTPVTVRSLVAPALGMSTGLFMFVVPQTRVPFTWALAALAVGALVFSVPLARSSTLARQGDQFLMKRSPAFVWILLGLVAARFALRSWIETWVSPLQTGALFFLIAFGAIVRWRVSMLFQLRRLSAAPP